ncbi:unnamed protein product [Effrenium voratum]|nr:unnamed protein product [Effrenium voratum]
MARKASILHWSLTRGRGGRRLATAPRKRSSSSVKAAFVDVHLTDQRGKDTAEWRSKRKLRDERVALRNSRPCSVFWPLLFVATNEVQAAQELKTENTRAQQQSAGDCAEIWLWDLQDVKDHQRVTS